MKTYTIATRDNREVHVTGTPHLEKDIKTWGWDAVVLHCQPRISVGNVKSVAVDGQVHDMTAASVKNFPNYNR